MKRMLISVMCMLMLCIGLTSCYIKTTDGENDKGTGIAFPQPGKAEVEKTEIPNESKESEDSNELISDITVTEKTDENNSSAEKTEASDKPVNQDKPEVTESENNGGNNTEDKQPEEEQIPESEDWMLLLVNPWNYLPENYEVKLVKLKNGQQADERVYPELQRMMDDMRAEGLSPYICSSYRTLAKQTTLYDKQIKQYLDKGYSQEDAKSEAGKWVAVPGTSEHHTGLAFDIVAADHIVLDESQEKEPEQQWLMANSWKYGFILRYPNDKTDITGIYYEPWHYRYVGKKAAKEIYESGLTLEEYLQNM